ncbi:MAG: PQQ-binding-like beta-propeller repeat protein [Deltaproteobacteria bacterium]|nr:PQQ-binding-like beta-propeller repeat protein [Deltaproteobacteria bacterium]
MTSWAVALVALVLSEDGELFRFGGEAAVPGHASASPEAPVEVAPRPRNADAIYRTLGGMWRFYDGALDRVVELPLTGERLVGWSANGGSVITASATPEGGRLVRWRAGSWKQVAEMRTTTRPEDAAISPDGHHVLVAGPQPEGAGRRFTLFGGTVGLSLMKIDRADAVPAAPVALSDARAAIVRQGQVEILGLPRLDPERVIPIDGVVSALAFGEDGDSLVVLRDDAELVRFAVADGRPIGRAAMPDACGRGVVSTNGRVAACVLERRARVSLVDVDTGHVRATVPAPAGRRPVLDPAGTRVAFPGNRAVPVWDATSDGVLPAAARAGVVKALARGAGGHVVALEASGVARVWDPATGTESFRVPSPTAAIATAADGATLISGGTPVTALDPATGKTVWSVKYSRAIAVDAAADGRVFWVDRGGALHVRLANGRAKRLAAARGPRPTVGSVPRLAVSPDGKRVLFGDRVVDAHNGKKLDDVPAGPAAWLGDRLVVAGPERLASVDGQTVFEGAAAGPGAVTALASAPGWIAAGDKDGVVHVWRGDGARVTQRTLHRGPVLALVLDPERGRVFSAGGDGVILGTTWAR